MLVYISRLLSRRLFCDAFFSHSKGVCGGGNTRKARARFEKERQKEKKRRTKRKRDVSLFFFEPCGKKKRVLSRDISLHNPFLNFTPPIRTN